MKHFFILSFLMLFVTANLQAAFVVKPLANDSSQAITYSEQHQSSIKKTFRFQRLLQKVAPRAKLPKGTASWTSQLALAFAAGALIIPLLSAIIPFASLGLLLIIPAVVFAIMGLTDKEKTRTDQLLNILALSISGFIVLLYAAIIALLVLFLL